MLRSGALRALHLRCLRLRCLLAAEKAGSRATHGVHVGAGIAQVVQIGVAELLEQRVLLLLAECAVLREQAGVIAAVAVQHGLRARVAL